MGFLIALVLYSFAAGENANAQSSLLEEVKKNPNEAIALCKRFRSLNQKGVSASSDISLKEISQERNISKLNAEILSTYVRALHCPDVV
tara:strand:+ start:1138 stop:1404 length:267 start_codon:yes stop_codon:yes gene_type:complete